MTARVGAIYMLSGIGGSILSTLFIKNNISVGASGALFGLLGAMLSELLTNWTIYANKVRQLFVPITIGKYIISLELLPLLCNIVVISNLRSNHMFI